MTSTVSTRASKPKFTVVLKSEQKASPAGQPRQLAPKPASPQRQLLTVVTLVSSDGKAVTQMFAVPSDSDGLRCLKEYMKRRDNENLPDDHSEKRWNLGPNNGDDARALQKVIGRWIDGVGAYCVPRGRPVSVAGILLPQGGVVSELVHFCW